MDLYRTFLGGAPGREELLLATPEDKFPMDWSPMGDSCCITSLDPKSGFDLWALPLEREERKPFEVVQTEFNEGLAQFSPDGRWIAYQSEQDWSRRGLRPAVSWPCR